MNAPTINPAPARLEILEADDCHADAIADFIRAVWTPNATAASVRAARAESAGRNVAEPGLPPPTWLAMRAGMVVGYVTTIPIRIWDGRRDWPGYWIKGLMVLPEFRNGPIGYALMKTAVARLPRSGGLAVAAPARRLFGALGYSDLGAIPNWVRPLAPGRMLHRLDVDALGMASIPAWAPALLKFGRATGLAALAGWAGGVMLRGLAAARRSGGPRLTWTPFDPRSHGKELDDLWGRVCPAFPSGVVRDRAYLAHRYPVGAGSPYEWLAVREGPLLAGIVVLRQPRAEGDPRLGGIRVATLVDMLYDPARPALGMALLGAVERAARALEADAILGTASAPAHTTLFRRQFYLPISGNVHFLFRDVTAQGPDFGRTLSAWWLTRGDGNSDEVF